MATDEDVKATSGGVAEDVAMVAMGLFELEARLGSLACELYMLMP